MDRAVLLQASRRQVASVLESQGSHPVPVLVAVRTFGRAARLLNETLRVVESTLSECLRRVLIFLPSNHTEIASYRTALE
eukprot:3966560-Pyramimonas_sp.AAC.1